jgi:hypothetical protein
VGRCKITYPGGVPTTPRITSAIQAVLLCSMLAYRDDPAREVYGLELCELLGLGFGTVYRIVRGCIKPAG